MTEESDIEDKMLSSAYENFVNTIEIIENNSNSSPIELENQIELLKEILIQANLHLECYHCHDRILTSQNKKLLQKRKSLRKELNSLKNPNIFAHEHKDNALLIENAIKERMNIENHIIKYKLSLENLKIDEERLMEEVNHACQISKMKDNEIKNLNSQIERLKSQKFAAKTSSSKSNSEKRGGINKEEIKPYPVSSYSLGISTPSQKSTTIESSRSSH